jgi:hypothetical protein
MLKVCVINTRVLNFFYLIFILFVNDSYSINFSASNIPKNLISAIGFSAALFNSASGDSLQDQVDTQRYKIWSLEGKIVNIENTSTVAIAGVVLGTFCAVACIYNCCVINGHWEKLSGHTIRINNLSITNRENITEIQKLTQRIDKLEQGLNAK